MIINLVIILLNTTMSFVRSKLSLAIIATLTTSVFANETTSTQTQGNEESKSAKLNTIIVEAEKNSEVGKTVYSKEDLQNTPNSSKNITDFLKVNPNVQFGNNFRSGLQQGELNAADISINGSLSYDNKILVNGLSINNNINPVGSSNSVDPMDLMGSNQSASVNTDLLCNIQVFDSNIGAEYGEFTGGVVSAETCKPTSPVGKLHGSLSYDYTSDDWSKINFADSDSQLEFENSTTSGQQPYFTKQGVSATLYGNLTENIGFNTFGSFRHALIPLKTNLVTPDQIDQKRKSSNAGAELFYSPSSKTDLKIGAQFFENTGSYFQDNTLNSDTEHQSDSQSFYINLKNQLDTVKIDQQFNYQTQKSSRSAEKDIYTWLTSSSKNWKADSKTQTVGSYGSLKQEEEKLEYSIKALFNPINTNHTTHQFKLGAGYGHYDAYWERPETSNYYLAFKNLNGINCSSIDGSNFDACDEGNGLDGQFAQTRWQYLAGKIDIQQDRWHAFIEDKIRFTNYLEASLGFRTDYDSISKNNNVAPRSSFTVKPFGNNQLMFTTGWNRYFGLNSFYNDLQDRRGNLQTRQSRTNVENEWKNINYNPTTNLRSELDTPYSDEMAFSISGNYKNINGNVKFVNRQYKDQIRKTQRMSRPELTGTTALVDQYDNSGRSESDTLTLTLQNIEPLKFLKTHHRFSFNANITDTERNFENYNSAYYSGTPEIYYDGKLIDAEDMPASNFNIPWSVRLNWNIGFDNIPLNIHNYLNYSDSTLAMKKIVAGKTDSYELNGISYDTYVPHETKKSFNWDIKTTYEIPLFKDLNSVLGLTINNVTNRNNVYIDSNGVAKPEIGRQFIADVTFKF